MYGSRMEFIDLSLYRGKYNKLHIRKKVRIINKNILVTTRSSYKLHILLDEIDFI